MPTSVVGLLFFAALLVPGLVHLGARRTVIPYHQRLSPFMETTQLVAVSLAVNSVILAAFGAARLNQTVNDHTPDVRAILTAPRAYIVTVDDNRLMYVAGWAAALLCLACLLAFALGRRLGPLKAIDGLFVPAVATVPMWWNVFRDCAPSGTVVFVGLQLQDGGYALGRLDWFSTEPEESADRDIVIAPPITLLDPAGEPIATSAERLIYSARDIRRIDVTYPHASLLEPNDPPGDTEPTRDAGFEPH